MLKHQFNCELYVSLYIVEQLQNLGWKTGNVSLNWNIDFYAPKGINLEDELSQFGIDLNNILLDKENRENLEWVLDPDSLAWFDSNSRIGDDSLIEHLAGKDISGLWIHVFNYPPSEQEWQSYLESFMSIEGEVCVSTLDITEPLYKGTGDDRWGVMLKGMASYVWDCDIMSSVKEGGLRIAHRVGNELRTEAWIVPSKCEFKGIIRV